MKIDQFRETRASELETGAKILEKVFVDINTTPIYNAINSLKNQTPKLKDGSTNIGYWGYSIENLKIPVDSTRHVKPKSVDPKNVELILDISLIGDFTKWESLNDPLLELRFNVVIRGLSQKGEHFFCFHIDRHDPIIATEEHHPTYHLQYYTNPNGDPTFDYGSTFHLDSPRINHHPLDLILGLGFLTSNFFPYAFDTLMDDGYFSGLYKRYQEYFLKPYFHTLSSYWKTDGSAIVWNKNQICPSLI